MNLWPFRRRVSPTAAARTLSTMAAAQRTEQCVTERQAALAKAKWIAGRIEDEGTRKRLLARFGA